MFMQIFNNKKNENFAMHEPLKCVAKFTDFLEMDS